MSSNGIQTCQLTTFYLEQLSFIKYWQETFESHIEDSENRFTPFHQKEDTELLQYLGFEVQNVRGSIHRILKQLQRNDIRAKAFCELVKRYNKNPFPKGKRFEKSADIFHYYQHLREEKQERFIVVLLDSLQRFIEEHTVTIGIHNKIIIHPRELFFPALANKATAIICIRNNTDGTCKPRAEDFKMIRRMGEVGRIVGVPVLDYLIIGDLEYYSMADEREM